ncbi:hypothetical protein OSB04_023283 [Centaurea solstitialis]|uniref:Uncharacterized protein n=1 Tax=Centaurea solstitialis TaxID=347529 RepID=A0AA38WCR6_9ASTR|nr:hypothetical protein OSB04_023283 [Centaurea solstitialis]
MSSDVAGGSSRMSSDVAEEGGRSEVVKSKRRWSLGESGKNSWPELVGWKGECAATKIEEENPQLNVIVLLEGTPVTKDLRCDRVRVWVDCHGIVIQPPTTG